ncbi:MAG: VOC family protein [Ilumatobacteraceae bacterium]
MSINVQIVLDCRDSVQLARWWAETLDWKFEWEESNPRQRILR